MSNTYFQFKQFTVHQQNVAMKVCTDACLFGGWIAEKIENKLDIQTILDIGTGTGLLSLMLAQKSKAKIDAVEIDQVAAQQAQGNVSDSPFRDQIKVLQADIKNFETNQRYDLIISNPPFFENDLKSNNQQRNLALHSEELSLQELVAIATQSLQLSGSFAVLLPYNRMIALVEFAKKNELFLQEQLMVKQTEKHDYFRVMLWFKKAAGKMESSDLIIKNKGQYSKEFIELLKDYYLYL
jgi:tRNA1Val (adenine37-N6)-methyltransferase